VGRKSKFLSSSRGNMSQDNTSVLKEARSKEKDGDEKKTIIEL
jgi:hypothetical protein